MPRQPRRSMGLRPHWAGRLAGRVVAARSWGAPPRPGPGYLVLNPLGVPRRVAVVLPDAALDLRPEGPLRAAQFTEEGVCAVVDLPAFGFAWVPGRGQPRGCRPAASGASRPADARSRTSRSRSRSTRPPAGSAA